jgi:Tfp pilus assembly protein PilV
MRNSGFSLIEVNMAVFVLAVGILSMAVLYPLGLRESMQSQSDIKQSMFADYVLSMAVAKLSKIKPESTSKEVNVKIEELKKEIEETFKYKTGRFYKYDLGDYELNVSLGNERSKYLVGISVRSLDTDMETSDQKSKRLNAQPLYYAEVRY